MTPLVLASGSPRRRILLGLLVDDFQVMVPDVDETLPDGDVATAMERVAERKAAAVDFEGAVALAADTAIIADGVVLGKPTDAADARRMLKGLQGRDHDVVTAVAVTNGERSMTFHIITQVRLDLPDSDLDRYLDSGAWQGKAGAYGIQDAGMADHATFQGPWSNVVGLPLQAVHDALASFGIHGHAPPPEDQLVRQNPF